MLTGCAAAIGIGVLTVLLVLGGLWLVLGELPGLGEEWGIIGLWVLWIAAPFGLLALAGIRTRLPWLVGIILTVVLWGYFVADPFLRGDEDPGANIGLGWVIIVSPIIIAAVSFVAARLAKRASSMSPPDI